MTRCLCHCRECPQDARGERYFPLGVEKALIFVRAKRRKHPLIHQNERGRAERIDLNTENVERLQRRPRTY